MAEKNWRRAPLEVLGLHGAEHARDDAARLAGFGALPCSLAHFYAWQVVVNAVSALANDFSMFVRGVFGSRRIAKRFLRFYMISHRWIHQRLFGWRPDFWAETHA